MWWGQARCTRHFPEARPDAFAIWVAPTTEVDRGRVRAAKGAKGERASLSMFLEYDTGSETLHQLAAKLAGYHELALRTPEHRPLLLFWFPTPAREHHARRALTDALERLACPGLISIATGHRQPHRPDLGWHPHHRTWQPLAPPPALYGQPRLAHQPLVRVSLNALTAYHAHTTSPAATDPGYDLVAAGDLEPFAPLDTELAAPRPHPPPVAARR